MIDLSNIRRRFIACALLSSVVLGAGCVHFEQRLILRADKTGTIEYEYNFSDADLPILTTAQRAIEEWQGQKPADARDDLNWMFNQKLAAEYFSTRHTVLATHEISQRDGRTTVAITTVMTDALAALKGGKLGDFDLQRERDGDYTLTLALASNDQLRTEMTPAEVAKLQTLCGDMRLRLEILVPTTIIRTTGKKIGRRTAIWDLEPGRDSDVITNPPRIQVRFSGVGLDW